MPNPPWMRRLAVGLVALAIVGLLYLGWSQTRRREVSIQYARGAGSHLDLAVDGCNLDGYRHEVEETARTVTITVTANGKLGGDRDDCGGPGLSITLDEPLGDRELVDGSTDEAIPLDP